MIFQWANAVLMGSAAYCWAGSFNAISLISLKTGPSYGPSFAGLHLLVKLRLCVVSSPNLTRNPKANPIYISEH